MKKSSYVLLLSLTGCSTASEVFLENGSPTDYVRTKDSSGHTKYVRHRVVSDYDSYRPSPTYYSYSPPSPETTRPLIQTLAEVADTVNLLRAEDANASLLYTPATGGSDETSSEDDTLSSIVATVSANDETANLDLSYEWLGKNISGGVGIAFLGSDRSYFGFNGQARLHFPWRVTPYIGIGLYGGDSKTCTYEPLGGGYSEEICEKYVLFALTGDAGLQVTLTDHARLRLFARGFSQTRQGDPLGATLYGMGTVITF